jgi:Fe-S-cluster containining protein
VKRGGHAVVWRSPNRARLVVRKPDEQNPSDLGEWAMLDIGVRAWKVAKAGPLRGLAVGDVPPRCTEIAVHWASRDSIHPGPVRRVRLDCRACAACCRKNEVLLQRRDFERMPELKSAALSHRRRRDGKLVLRLTLSKDCKLLGSDNACTIYALRPEACRTFPVASEGCLFAREEELGVIDGAREPHA